jgi:His-Xaa-Ser system radical SAM maturase HxsB
MTATLTPFRLRDVNGSMLVTNEAGDYGFFDGNVVERYFGGALTGDEHHKLRDLSIIVEDGDEWRLAALMRRLRKAHEADRSRLSYLIVIPTLRCDLSCSYCQVSRASLDASGFDWTEEHLAQFERFLDTVEGDHLKLEFQGGEPTVRPDLLRRVIVICTGKFKAPEFVICTNLTRITPEIEDIFARPDVSISTSIDGPLAVMTANRTASDELSETVFRNFRYIVDKYGPDKVAALPTVTEKTIADPQGLIDCYATFGFQSIFLRPVNYMGFARKKHADLSCDFAAWNTFYRAALERIIDLNQDGYFEEFYLALMLRSIFAGLPSGFVDLRSPSRFASDYCVIDFDGTLYPSDEARMLSRTRTIDLSIGTMGSGFDESKLAALNRHAINQVHPDCLHCAYMPYCGIDIVDDISRCGRTDMPKHETWFCNRQMSLFDLIFEKVAAQDRRYLDVFLKWIYRRTDPPQTYELFHD